MKPRRLWIFSEEGLSALPGLSREPRLIFSEVSSVVSVSIFLIVIAPTCGRSFGFNRIVVTILATFSLRLLPMLLIPLLIIAALFSTDTRIVFMHIRATPCHEQ